MGRLIRDLLDVSAMDSGGFSVRRGRVDLDGLLAAVVTGASAEAEGSGGMVELDIEPEVSGRSVEGDWDRLLQALLNLVGNALKFSPPGGRVAVGAALERPHEPDRVCITVDDEGPGVPEELRDRLFEPFRQGQRGDRRGAGLGLAIVRGIVTAHGGEVAVDDAPDGGARFVVRLSLDRSPDDSSSTPGAAPPR
jgi:signal transduction histidine kinase